MGNIFSGRSGVYESGTGFFTDEFTGNGSERYCGSMGTAMYLR
jgi:hypothetical protein